MTDKTKSSLAYWKKIVILLCMGWVTIWIYRSALSPVYPQIRASLNGNASDTALGSISSFYFLGYVVMQIPAGFLVDKIGKKRVLIPGFILFALAALLIAQAQTIGTIYLGSLLAGLGCGSFYGSAYSLTSQNIPQAKKSFATPWQVMMYISAFMIICMLVAFQVIIRNHKEDMALIQPTVVDEKDNGAVKEKVPFKKLFAPHMLFAYILYFGTCYAYYMIVTWLPNFLSTERGFQGAAIGLSSSLVAFASIPGALFFSRLADKYMHKKVQFIVVLEFLATAMLLLTVQVSNATLLLIALIMYGFLGKLAVEPIIISWLGENAPKIGIGTTLGVFNFFGMMSSVIAPALTGKISDTTGSKVMGFYIAVVILLIGTILFMLVNLKKRGADSSNK